MKILTSLEEGNLKNVAKNVYGTNVINMLALEATKHFLPQLQKFIGKKIFLADGNKSKNFVIDRFETNDFNLCRSYICSKYGYLRLEIDVFVCGNYYSRNINLGTLDGGILLNVLILEDIIEERKLNVVYDCEEIKKIAAAVEIKKEELYQLERQIKQFM